MSKLRCLIDIAFSMAYFRDILAGRLTLPLFRILLKWLAELLEILQESVSKVLSDR